MSIRINNIKIPIESDVTVREKIQKLLDVSENDIENFSIIKQSVDARKKTNLKLVYSVLVDLKCNEEEKVNNLGSNDVSLEVAKTEQPIEIGTTPLKSRPIIVGFGPAGLFSGYLLAKYGYNPIIIERGADVDKRTMFVEKFWNEGVFSPENNVQFGEGGAGAFSDGKLNTGINNPDCINILKTLVEFGAPDEILWQARPHVGTDILKNIVKNMRNEIIRLGGSVEFESTLEDIKYTDKLESIKVNGEWRNCHLLILAPGHSARDTFEMLMSRGVIIQSKPFSVGLRIEHIQKNIDEAQYGDFAGHSKLAHCEYKLADRINGRGVYTFCMCPGGVVVSSASEENTVVTNGMSYHARDGINANSGIVVEVKPEDLNSDSPLSGIYFQRELEKAAFLAGGGNYNAPVQKIGDFLNTEVIGDAVIPTYKPGVTETDLKQILPQFVTDTISAGLICFNRKIKGFTSGNALLTGVETRTSSPVRIMRNEKLMSVNVNGLYPAGEGAGYAGGIMSAAVDGLKIAKQIISEYKN